MVRCVFFEGCSFLSGSMENQPVAKEIYQESYCMQNFEQCAVHAVAKVLGGNKVPSYLYPDMQQEAQRIILRARDGGV